MTDTTLASDNLASTKPTARIAAILERLASSRWFAYGTLLLVQFKVVFEMWLYRDITGGDTPHYFQMAVGWHNNGQGLIHWSPLYTGFYGFLLNFSSNAYAVTILHRLIIVFVVSTLVLALMRRLLPHSVAWLIAAWWVVLPTTFDALNEVHLFAVIPTILAYLVVLYKPTIWTRGAGLGLFVLSGVLSRNEILIAAGLWALLCFGWEIYQARTRGAQRLLVYLRAYGIPVLVVAIVVGFFYWRSALQYPALAQSINHKHTLNVCQVFAFNYQQRNPDWGKSPFLDCEELMTQVFGVPLASMTEALGRNPQAMLDFFLWNLRLIPDGIQTSLFNATSGTGQPDYILRPTGATYPLVLSIVFVGVLVVGGWLLRRYGWWETWIKPRIWGWLALLCVVCVMVIVMLTQRPRPSYLYNLFLFLSAVFGLCSAVIIDRLVGLKRFALAFPIIALALILIVPTYFTPDYVNPGNYPGRPVWAVYQRLVPYHDVYSGSGTRLLGSPHMSSVCLYSTETACSAVAYTSLIAEKPADVSLADWLVEQDIDAFYADESILADPVVQEFLANSAAEGWETVANVQTETENWRLLRRRQ